MNTLKNQYRRKVMEAYKKVDRRLFIPKTAMKVNVDDNFPIEYGQNITQSKIVVDMLVECEIEKTHRVLEIGTGSGYQTLLLSLLCKEVYTVELINELSINAQNKINAFGLDNIHYLIGDGTLGWEEYLPYDRILVSACCSVVPQSLFRQLSVNGIMVVPVGEKENQRLMKYFKLEDGTIKQEMLYDVSFVEFKGENGWQ